MYVVAIGFSLRQLCPYLLPSLKVRASVPQNVHHKYTPVVDIAAPRDSRKVTAPIARTATQANQQ
jgi:hypothetical protein